MAERYNIQYEDVIGNDFEISIYNSTYAGSSTSLNGDAIYGMTSLDHMSDPIRSKFLKLNLLADATNTLSDLLDADEREWSVTLSRNSSLIFFGYLTSEGVIQSYVTEQRYISFDVLDPMAFLEDLAYTDNSGNLYTGRDTLAHIIAKCLQRGFEPTPTSAWFDQIKAYVPFDSRYLPIGGSLESFTAGDFLSEHNLNQDIWIDEDSGDEVKSCMEVLKEVLSSLNLVITQSNGNSWVIYHYLFSSISDISGYDPKHISYYDYNGDTRVAFNVTPFNTIEILTDSVANQGQFIHCNENQSYQYKRGVQKLLLEHNFIYEGNIIENWELDGGTTGGTIPDWTVYESNYGYVVNDGTFRLYLYDVTLPSGTDSLAIYSDPGANGGTGFDINLPPRGEMKVVGSFKAVGYDDAVFRFNVKIDTGTGNPYYISWAPNEGGAIIPVWSRFATEPTNSPTIPAAVRDEIVDFEYLLPTPLPDGVISVRLHASSWGISGPPGRDPGRYIELYEINVVGAEVNRTGTSYSLINSDIVSLKTEREEIYIDTWKYTSIANNLILESTGDPVYYIEDKAMGNTYRQLGELVGHNYLASHRRRIIFSGLNCCCFK